MKFASSAAAIVCTIGSSCSRKTSISSCVSGEMGRLDSSPWQWDTKASVNAGASIWAAKGGRLYGGWVRRWVARLMNPFVREWYE